MDDMLVKSLKANEHIRHLEEVSQILRRYITQLNPPKCAFGITSRKFLGYKVNQRGIKANPYKIRALVEMKSS